MERKVTSAGAARGDNAMVLQAKVFQEATNLLDPDPDDVNPPPYGGPDTKKQKVAMQTLSPLGDKQQLASNKRSTRNLGLTVEDRHHFMC